jgi:hypothetical protein
VIANESLDIKVQGMLIPEAALKNIILYTHTELYMMTFGP